MSDKYLDMDHACNGEHGKRLVKVLRKEGAKIGLEHYALSQWIQRRQRSKATLVMEAAGINRRDIINFTSCMFGPQVTRRPLYMGMELVSVLRRDGACDGGIKKHLLNLIETTKGYEERVKALPLVVLDAVKGTIADLNPLVEGSDGKVDNFVTAGSWVRTSLGFGKVDFIFPVGGKLGVRVHGRNRDGSVWREETANFKRLCDFVDSPLIEFLSDEIGESGKQNWIGLLNHHWKTVKNPQRNVMTLERAYGGMSLKHVIIRCPFVNLAITQ